jgi:hypothetical protein
VGAVTILLTCLPLFAAPQDPEVIDQAVRKGVDYLRSREEGCLLPLDVRGRKMPPRELVLWTLLCSGCSLQDPFLQKLFDSMMKDKLEATTPVALQAMILESVQRVQFQKRIAMCAKFLADNQTDEGLWGYGSLSVYVEDVEWDLKPRRPLQLPEAPQNPRVFNRFKIRKDRSGEDPDASNSFFAALGIRAASEAGAVFEERFLHDAWRGWKAARGDRGWGYDRWNPTPYPAAAAGAVSSTLILGSLLGRNLKRDPLVVGGVELLEKPWNGAAGGGASWVFPSYGLYVEEVAELFLGREKPGDRARHAEGAALLLDSQKPDGSWSAASNKARVLADWKLNATYLGNTIWDTCFSILVLTKGMKPLEMPAPSKKE